MTQFQKPLVQTNGCILYPVAMQCAICFSHFRVQSLALATIFAIALLPVLLLLLPAMKFALSLPRVLPRAFAHNPNFAIEFAARAFTPAAYLPVFFATDVAIHGFFHPCCPADCHRHCHCHCFCPRGCHACCHQINLGA